MIKKQAHPITDKLAHQVLTCLFTAHQTEPYKKVSASECGLTPKLIDALSTSVIAGLIRLDRERRGNYLSIAVNYADFVSKKISELQAKLQPDLSQIAREVDALPLIWPEHYLHKRIVAAFFSKSSKHSVSTEAKEWLHKKELKETTNTIVTIRCNEPLKITKNDGSLIQLTPSEQLNQELLLNDLALNNIQSIELASGQRCTLFTIENLAAYRYFTLQHHEIALHQPGFDDRYTSVLLGKIRPAQIIHCGDLDIQGITIAKRLATTVTVPFYFMLPKPYWLDRLISHFSKQIEKLPDGHQGKGGKDWPCRLDPIELQHRLGLLINNRKWLEQETFVLFQRKETELIRLNKQGQS